jgi:trimeric autotransporter adhesin
LYVFARTGSTWTQESYIKSSNPGAGDYLCHSALSRDGDVLVAGASTEDSAATGIDGDQLDDSATSAGAAYLFGHRSGRWGQDAYIKATNTDPGDRFGGSLAVSHDGGTIAIGAPREASGGTGFGADPLDNSAPVAGAVYVLER